jgi:hypothetical protein
MTATPVKRMALAPSSAADTGVRSRGPVIGVLATPNSPTAITQQVSGAAARSSTTRHAAARCPVRRATCATANAMPAANHIANVGSQAACRVWSSAPTLMATSQPTVVTTPPAVMTTTVRTGRQRRRTVTRTSTGRSR